jgi:hypothetical protein
VTIQKNKMKKAYLYIGILFTAAISFSGCKNDLNVLAPGQEMISVYGILNPSEPVQNIRINKVYLVEGDALAAGQDANQINYGAGELEVSLERYVDGTQMDVNTNYGTITSGSPDTDKRIVLTETVVTTQSGTFSSSQRIWQTNKKLITLQPTASKANVTEYKLVVRKTSDLSKVIASSQNVLIDSVKNGAAMPFIHNTTLYPAHGEYVTTGCCPTANSGYVDYSAFTVTRKVKFKSIPNAKLYNITVRLHYLDFVTTSTVVTSNYADMKFNTTTSSSLAGNEDIEVSFVSNDFCKTIATEISKNPVANLNYRKVDYIEYIVEAGASSLADFLQVNQPSSTIAQDRPYYTNITNGVGVFSSRSTSRITHDLLAAFVDKIACHPSMYPLLFRKFDGTAASSPCP